MEARHQRRMSRHGNVIHSFSKTVWHPKQFVEALSLTKKHFLIDIFFFFRGCFFFFFFKHTEMTFFFFPICISPVSVSSSERRTFGKASWTAESHTGCTKKNTLQVQRKIGLCTLLTEARACKAFSRYYSESTSVHSSFGSCSRTHFMELSLHKNTSSATLTTSY